jgi:hypothetical protein
VNHSTASRFGKLLRDPAFRVHLPTVGYTPGMTAYCVAGWQTEEQVRAEMDPGRHLLVVEDETQPWGLRMIVCEIDR